MTDKERKSMSQKQPHFIVMVHCLGDDVIVGCYWDPDFARQRYQEAIEDPRGLADQYAHLQQVESEVCGVSLYRWRGAEGERLNEQWGLTEPVPKDPAERKAK